FWDSIATRINQEHNTSFNGYQCKEKFINLVRDYNVTMGIEEHEEAERRPEDEFDRIRNINSSNHRRNRDVGNTTPAPPIEEVEHALSMRSSHPLPPIESLSPQLPPYSR
ncbi:19201_t:CDS:2, partial [Gigaspora rosea]